MKNIFKLSKDDGTILFYKLTVILLINWIQFNITSLRFKYANIEL